MMKKFLILLLHLLFLVKSYSQSWQLGLFTGFDWLKYNYHHSSAIQPYNAFKIDPTFFSNLSYLNELKFWGASITYIHKNKWHNGLSVFRNRDGGDRFGFELFKNGAGTLYNLTSTNISTTFGYSIYNLKNSSLIISSGLNTQIIDKILFKDEGKWRNFGIQITNKIDTVTVYEGYNKYNRLLITIPLNLSFQKSIYKNKLFASFTTGYNFALFSKHEYSIKYNINSRPIEKATVTTHNNAFVISAGLHWRLKNKQVNK